MKKVGPVFWTRQCLAVGQQAAKALNAGKTERRFFLEKVACLRPAHGRAWESLALNYLHRI